VGLDLRFVEFLGVAAVLIATPGPDTALLVRNALRGGWPAGWRTAAGISTGQLLWGVASGAGIASMLAMSATAFTVVKYAGAAYLGYLGIRSLLAARRPTGGAGHHPPAERVPGGAYLQGIANNLLNPKAAVIFVSIVPQFIRPGDPPARLALMVVAFSLMTLGWLMVYAAVVVRARQRLGPTVQRVLDSIAGGAMIVLGLRLAVERA
jgi:threonine/homoserine/homoserine lactone efflux protein